MPLSLESIKLSGPGHGIQGCSRSGAERGPAVELVSTLPLPRDAQRRASDPRLAVTGVETDVDAVSGRQRTEFI